MTDKTEQTELETLRAHNVDLLAELKAAKADRKRLTDDLETRTGERDTAAAEVRKFKLGLPLEDMLEQVAVPGLHETWLAEFNRAGFRFELDNDTPVVRDADGKPPMIQGPKDEEPRPAGFNYGDLVLLVCGPDGVAPDKRTPSQRAFASLTTGSLATGAGGHTSAGDARSSTPDTKPTPPPGPSYGLQ